MEFLLKYGGYLCLIVGSCLLISSMPSLYQNDEDIDIYKYKIRFYTSLVFILFWLTSLLLK